MITRLDSSASNVRLGWTRRRMLWLLTGTATSFGIHACTGSSKPADSPSSAVTPLTVGTSAWPGFAGDYVATAKEFYKAAGLTVTSTFFQVASDVNTALLAGKLDLAWTGVPDMVVMAAKDPTLRLIAMSDYSNGADGILARNVTQASDLKGQSIAWEGLPLQALLLRKYLQSGGLTEKDVKLTVIAAAEAASAFAAKKIDVAVTYEPWLAKSAAQGEGKVIFSSKDSNIIPVGLVAREAVIKARQAEITTYLKAFDQGVKLLRQDLPAAAPIIAEKLGVKPEEVANLLKTVRIFDIAENKSIVFNPSNPLNVMDSLEFAAKTCQDIGLLSAPIDGKTLYDDSLINAI